MNTLQNLHQHTAFCDGKDTTEQVVLAAIEKGFGAIGFSGHCYTPYDYPVCPEYCMSPEQTEQYRQEIQQLKDKYADWIEIYCGLEYDFACPLKPEGFEYMIGSIHGLKIHGEDVEFDGSAEKFRHFIDQYFDGDGMDFAITYFRQVATLPEYGDFDILGHFDLITKYRDRVDLFDTTAKQYRFAAIEAAEALAGKIPYFEVNTGAIARGYRTTPYPDPFIVKELKRLGFGAVISSDCHDANQLDCGFDVATQLLKDCGFEEKYILTKEGFRAVPL